MMKIRKRDSTWSRLDSALLIGTLILAVFVACVADREFMVIEGLQESVFGGADSYASASRPCRRLSYDYIALLTVVTIGGTLILARGYPRRRKGRPPTPGVIVFSVAVVLGVFYTLVYTVVTRSMDTGVWMRWDPLKWPVFEDEVSGVVLGAGTMFALGGRWRRRCRDGYDRLGRIIGWGWLGVLGLKLGIDFFF